MHLSWQLCIVYMSMSIVTWVGTVVYGGSGINYFENDCNVPPKLIICSFINRLLFIFYDIIINVLVYVSVTFCRTICEKVSLSLHFL